MNPEAINNINNNVESAQGQGASPEQEVDPKIESATEEVLQGLDAFLAETEQIDLSKATPEQRNKLAELWSTLKGWARVLTVSILPLFGATALAQAHRIEAKVVNLGVVMSVETPQKAPQVIKLGTGVVETPAVVPQIKEVKLGTGAVETPQKAPQVIKWGTGVVETPAVVPQIKEVKLGKNVPPGSPSK
jgi:hypothetical protein